jgi:hypothetical protein
VLRRAESVSIAHEVEVHSVANPVATHFLHPDESCARLGAKSISVAHEVGGVLRRDAVSASVACDVKGVLPRDAKSVSVACDAKSASTAREAEGASVEVEGVLLRRDAKSVSAARDAKSVSTPHEVDGVLRRDAMSVSVALVRGPRTGMKKYCFKSVAHEVEGVLSCDAKSVSVARDAKSVSVAHEVGANLWSCDCPMCHSRRTYFLALEEVLDPLCLPGVGGAAMSELCAELCARLAARSSLHAVDWRSVLEKLAAKVSDEMPAVVQSCRGSGRDLAQRHYGRFLDSLEELFCELL